VPSLRAAAPHVPPELARICERALALDREDRYPSALAMQRDLEAFAVMSGTRIDGPEVGRVVSEWFDEERRRVRGVIESQLGSLRWTGENPAASSLPLIPTPTGPITGREWSGTDPRRARAGATPSGIPTNSGAALPMPAPSPSPRRSVVAALVGVALAALVVGVVVVKLVRPTGRATDPGGAAAQGVGTPSPSASAATAPSESVTLKVRVSPDDAKIYLDGVLLGTGSYDGKVERSDGVRVLRIEAEGHQTKEERLALTSDLMTSFALEKLDDKTATSASATPGTFRPTGPRPRPTGRGIDSDSPYKNP
jgi:serine/threonine-protein kinase